MIFYITETHYNMKKKEMQENCLFFLYFSVSFFMFQQFRVPKQSSDTLSVYK